MFKQRLERLIDINDRDLMLYLSQLDLNESLDDLRQIVGDNKFTFKILFDTLKYLRKGYKMAKSRIYNCHIYDHDSWIKNVHFYENKSKEYKDKMDRLINYICDHFEPSFRFDYDN